MAKPAEFAEGIRGVVWDTDADAPAAGMAVRLEANGQVIAQTATDQSGVFSFESTDRLAIASGTYRLVLDARGRRIERKLQVQASEPVTLVGRIEI